MDRRTFLKNSALALGALSVSGMGGFSALAASRAEAPRKAGAIGTPRFRKAMMWGCVAVEGSVLDKCRAVKAAGFDGVEPDSHMDRAEVLAAMKETGLVVASVCNVKHWGSPLSSPDPAVRQAGMDAMVVAMEDAKAYGTDTVLLVPGIVNKEVTYAQCWDRSTACIRELLPEAKKLGVNIAIENVWNGFLLSPLEAVRYVDQFDSPRVGFYFDVGNILDYGWPDQWIDILGERILRIHIKDYSKEWAKNGGKGTGFNVPLAEGDNDWTSIMRALRENYTHEWLTIEHGGGETAAGLKTLSEKLDDIIRA